ncbi:Protein of unknown function DUF227,Protein kinase-like domain,CHK kinase-like [Cinara cedri]|uniref:CHK kinase-like domain-containing protein n=1 Tax=Cinara cedri TaxID=506608 RepID=A0A5E4NIP3_9HEMI|nr:Protein of unknown function DUF227,Protein kinase-like domain,CHK kinase-like [Cinara cedri]
MDSLILQELPRIVDDGAFGKNVEFVSFEKNTDTVSQDQYMSVVSFGTVLTSDGSKYNVLIKCKTDDKVKRERYKIDLQFHNEILMYEKIVPFLLMCRSSVISGLSGPSIPRFFYGRNSFDASVENDLIILENVNPSGFRLSEERLFLDYDHLVKALQAIAKFHGLSYIAKHKDLTGFREVIKGVIEKNKAVDEKGSWPQMLYNSLHKFGKRGIDRLLERDGVRYRGNDNLRRFEELIKDGVNSAKRAYEPREPWSVLCHGDFNRNNMLFRYDGDGGRPVDTLLFDFGTPIYGSPVLDLSFFLYMNTTQQMRESRLDDLLNVYCATLAASVPAGVRVMDRAVLDAEMAKSALTGFASASFFLPTQLSETYSPPTDVSEKGVIDFFLNLGDTAGTEYVADMVQHMVDMSYIDV